MDQIRDLARRLPLTLTLLVLCPAVSLVAHPFDGEHALGYGVPAVLAGNWWLFVAGTFVVPTLMLVPVLALLLGAMVGLLEARLGTRRALLVVVTTQLAGTLGAAGVLLVGRLLPWPWAEGLARLTDVGPSAGAMGALAVLATTLRPPAGRTVVALAGGYLAVMLLCSGLLWDLEHALAFLAGLLLASSVTGRPRPAGVRRSPLAAVRGAAALLILAMAACAVVQSFYPGYGGLLGPGPAGRSGGLGAAPALLLLIGAAGLADGVRRGRRWAWATALVGIGLGLLLTVLGTSMSPGTLTCMVAMTALGLGHHRLSRRPGPGPVAPSADVRDQLRRHGGGTLGWQHTWTGTETWTSPDASVTLGFRRSAGVAIVVGEPVGPRFAWYAARRQFVEHCREQGLVVAWYAVAPAFLREAGLDRQALRIGEDAILDLPGLTMSGKAWQDVRTARNRATREGVRMVRLDNRTDPALVTQMHATCAGWMAGKALPEMGFTLGGVREALDPEVRTYLAVTEAEDGASSVHGVVSWLPVHRDGAVVGWTLDLMRRRSGGFRPVMEFLIAESALGFAAEGFESASLSVAPLARDEAPVGTLERLLDRSGALLEPAYGFGSLLAFKRKFSPRLTPVHLAYESCLDLPRIAIAIARAYVPHICAAEARSLLMLLLRRPTGRATEAAARPPLLALRGLNHPVGQLDEEASHRGGGAGHVPLLARPGAGAAE